LPPEIASLRQALAEARDEASRLEADLAESRSQLAAAATANEQLAQTLQQAKRPIADPGTSVPPDPATPRPPPTDDEILAQVGSFGEALGDVIRGGLAADRARDELRAMLGRAGKRGIDVLVAKFGDDATDIGQRLAIAHALAQSGSPDAIMALKAVLADPEAGMIELRLATHGLALSDAEGIEDALTETAHRAADTGARANAALGLARRKIAEGVTLYAKATDEAMANRDPVALQYLGGFMLLGDEALPPLRERLLTYTEPQAVITVIELLRGRGDKGAIENLEKLAADAGRPASVRKAAEGALKVLRGK
jgi:hypothetical protein